MDGRPVGMFDSGVGGLSVLESFRRLAREEDTIYFADTDWFPYGPRPAAEVRKRAFAICHRLLQSEVKLIVVACNTASGAAIEDLRAAFPVPFVGMVPGVKPATRESRSGRVVILATEGTFDGGLYARVVEEFGQRTRISAVAGSGLAELVEVGEAGSDHARTTLEHLLGPEIRAGADTVVLGCTHYHFLAPLIRDLFPGISIVDTSEAVARRAISILDSEGLRAAPGRQGELRFIVSGDRDAFLRTVGTLALSNSAVEATR